MAAMSLPLDRVLPYLKASVEDAGKPDLVLGLDQSPIFDPYVGSLLVSYVVDQSTEFRFVSEGYRRSHDGGWSIWLPS